MNAEIRKALSTQQEQKANKHVDNDDALQYTAISLLKRHRKELVQQNKNIIQIKLKKCIIKC